MPKTIVPRKAAILSAPIRSSKKLARFAVDRFEFSVVKEEVKTRTDLPAPLFSEEILAVFRSALSLAFR